MFQHRRGRFLRVFGALVPLLLLGCAAGREATPPSLPSADLRVVFVGNSLTYSHDVPGLVQAMADRAGRSMAHVTIADADRSLEDHWRRGLPETLRRLRPDVVVMQQGPSSLPRNRSHLAAWSRRVAGVAREVGGQPVLYMVWPPANRLSAFQDVWRSYREAAAAADAGLAPAGLTWVELWRRDPDAALYSPDGFHPGYLGALAAAQTLYAVLFNVPAESVPALDDGLDPATRRLLAEALAASLAAKAARYPWPPPPDASRSAPVPIKSKDVSGADPGRACTARAPVSLAASQADASGREPSGPRRSIGPDPVAGPDAVY